MNIGLAGSYNGLSKEQEDVFIRLVLKYRQKYKNITLCHGDSRGAEERLHALIMEKELGNGIRIFPPEDESIRAHLDREKKGPVSISVERPKPHHLRYQEMMNICDAIIVFPSDRRESVDEDIWLTVRMCKVKKTPVVTVFPDGNATRWPSINSR